MAKDDYHVIVYKILAYLYVQLKAGEEIDTNMIEHNGTLFDINEKYWIYIMTNMKKQGFIDGITVVKAFGNQCIIKNLEYCQITPIGIEYLCNNSLAEKAKAFLKEMKDVTPFI